METVEQVGGGTEVGLVEGDSAWLRATVSPSDGRAALCCYVLDTFKGLIWSGPEKVTTAEITLLR